MAAFAAQRLRLADEARRRVPTLPVSYDEHWCCSWTEAPAAPPLPSPGNSSRHGSSSQSSLSTSSHNGQHHPPLPARARPLYLVTVAVLNGPRAGEVVGCEQAVARPDGDALLDTLWGAMAFPLPAQLHLGPAGAAAGAGPTDVPLGPNAHALQQHESRARRPAGVLLGANLMPHYAVVAGALLAVDVACRLESRADAHAQAYRAQQHTAQQRAHKARAPSS